MVPIPDNVPDNAAKIQVLPEPQKTTLCSGGNSVATLSPIPLVYIHA